MEFDPSVVVSPKGDIPNNSIAFIFSGGCGHCHRALPEINKLAGGDLLANLGLTDTKVVAIDVQPNLFALRAGGLDITGVPTIVIKTLSGGFIPYEGPRMAEQIAQTAASALTGGEVKLEGGMTETAAAPVADALLGGAAPAIAGGKKRGRKASKKSKSRSRKSRSRKSRSRKSRSRKMRKMGGGETTIQGGAAPEAAAPAIEGGAVPAVEAAAPALEGGKKRGRKASKKSKSRSRKSRSRKSRSRKSRSRSRKMRGGETAIEGGEAAAALEGGKKRRSPKRGKKSKSRSRKSRSRKSRSRKMRGGDAPAALEGGKRSRSRKSRSKKSKSRKSRLNPWVKFASSLYRKQKASGKNVKSYKSFLKSPSTKAAYNKSRA